MITGMSRRLVSLARQRSPRRWHQARLRYIGLLFLAVLVGVLAAGGAYLFRELILLFQELFWGGEGGNFLETVRQAPWWLVLLVPTAAGLAVGPVITFFAPEARGPGVPEVIRAITVGKGVMRRRVAVFKALVTSLLLGAGASVGREGPIVQIGASVGSTIGGLFRLTPEMLPVLLASGAAAGIAATFNAPLTGALFAMEVILVEIEVAYMAHIIVAAVTASALSRFFWGHFAAFELAGPTGLQKYWELLIYAPMGVLAGLVAIAFIRSVFGADMFFERIPLPRWVKPAIGGLLLGLIALITPDVLGVGYETVNLALAGHLALGLALLLIVLKIAATSVCIGSGMSGGIMGPSFFLGAALGTVVSLGLNAIDPTLALHPQNYAVAGMAAVLAGTTLAPITALFTAVELTMSYGGVLPLMAACIASALTVRLLFGYSAYEMKLLRQGVNIVRGFDPDFLAELAVTEVMETRFETLHEDATFLEVLNKAAASRYPHYPVLDDAGKLVGMLSMSDLRPHIKDCLLKPASRRVRDMMTRTVVTVDNGETLNEALIKFEFTPVSCLPVIDPKRPGEVVGLLKKDALLMALRERSKRTRTLSGM
ncbi:chloride channel protein [Oceanidesulfovibrio marinus]|nr:chloride channel protein [Oceanidesulfovibrio marinus]